MEFSICIITKNECEKLEKCLRAARSLGCEIVVTDTGSEDATLEMAKKYTDSIYHFDWCSDFARAKNYSAARAANDMVFILDSDEYILPEKSEIEGLRALMEGHPGEVGRLKRANQVMQDEGMTCYRDFTNRIFDRRLFCFQGRIHEQLVRGNVFEGPSEDPYRPYATYYSGIIADHDGYVGSKQERKKKADRNLQLLLKELETRPEDTYILYQIGKAYFLMEDNEGAAKYLGRALEFEVEPSYEYVADLVETYGYALINCGRANEAVLLESVSEEFGKSSDFWFMLGLAYMNNAEFSNALAAFDRAIAVKNAKMQGVDSYLAWYNRGVIYECMGNPKEALDNYKRCGDYDRALAGLDRLRKSN